MSTKEENSQVKRRRGWSNRDCWSMSDLYGLEGMEMVAFLSPETNLAKCWSPGSQTPAPRMAVK